MEVKISIISLALVISLISVSGSIFLPYGFNNGDQLFRETDVSLNTSRQFLFYNKLYNTIYVKNKTLIYFKKGEERNYSINFTAPMAVGKQYIFYRESNETGLLTTIDQMLSNKSLVYNFYKNRWMFLITVVSQSVNSACDGTQKNACEAGALCQIVYATDGAKSTVIFIHDKVFLDLKYIGVNHGNGLTDMINVVNFLSEEIIVFNVNEKCSIDLNQNNGSLTVRPESVLYYGQQDVIFEGLCFGNGTKEVGVLINSIAVKCSIEFDYQIKCKTPYFDQLGGIQVSVVYNNFHYESVLIARDIQSEKEYYLFLDNLNYLVGSLNLPIYKQGRTTGLFKGVQQNIYHNTTDDSYTLKIFNIYKQFSISIDKVEYFPLNFVDNTSSIPDAVRILLSYNEQIFEIFLSKKSVNDETMCSLWKLVPTYNQYYGNYYNDYYGYYGACPSFLNQTSSLSYLTPDEDCNPSKPKFCQIVKPGVSQCFISMPNSYQNSYYKCCYGNDGAFRTDESYSQITGKLGKFDHFWQKIRPYLYCCVFTDDCTNVKKKLVL